VTVTDGYFLPMHVPTTQPTVLDLLARESAEV
jgi:hypothetical protein